ncbi:MAG: iron-sulfur cluster assembly accessory protein [Chitinophagales bacterium]|nr:iron-sulfur cluster assembly accessory protein [Chitinophagales bacterium]
MTDLDKKLPIKFTPTALKEIKRLNSLEAQDKVLCLGVKNGGCSGFTYVFEFMLAPLGSEIYFLDDLKLAIKPLDLQYLQNLEVDYEQGLNNRGFTFNNPNASTTCGCGTSFA